jgi:hypothetical protein
MKIVYFVTIAIFIAISIADASEVDNSLTSDEYYKFGVLKEINGMEELYNTYITLLKLSGDKKDILPKYNSKKSKEIYQMIFSQHHIITALTYINTTEEKINLLVKYRKLIDRFLSLYMTKTSRHNYDDEFMRIGLLKLHSILLIYEEYDRYYNANSLNVNDMFGTPNELYIFKTNLYDDICGTYILWPDRKMDKETKTYSETILKQYIERADKISFISEYKLNFNKEDCFALMNARDKAFKNLESLKQ